MTKPKLHDPTFELAFSNIANDFTFTRNSTATFVNQQGLVATSSANTPRIDYSTGQAAFLLEPQSTNLIPYSEDFSQGIWTKDNVTVTNGFTSPAGDSSAYKLQLTQISGVHLLNIAVTSSSVKTYSVFAKQNGYKRFRFNTGSSSNGYASFDLNNGSVVATGGTFYSSSSIEDYGNGWYKCSMTLLSNAPNKYNLAIEDDNGAVNFLGDGVSSIYVWGAQVEALPFSSSYIKTSGTTATRVQESCTDATPTINSEEGTLYAEVSALANDGTVRYFGLSDGSNSNRVVILFYGSANKVRGIVSSGGTKYVDFNYSVTNLTESHKIALKYKGNDFALWVDGVEGNTDITGITPIGLNSLSFDLAGSGNFFGNTKDLKIYDKALSDYQLKEITS